MTFDPRSGSTTSSDQLDDVLDAGRTRARGALRRVVRRPHRAALRGDASRAGRARWSWSRRRRPAGCRTSGSSATSRGPGCRCRRFVADGADAALAGDPRRAADVAGAAGVLRAPRRAGACAAPMRPAADGARASRLQQAHRLRAPTARASRRRRWSSPARRARPASSRPSRRGDYVAADSGRAATRRWSAPATSACVTQPDAVRRHRAATSSMPQPFTDLIGPARAASKRCSTSRRRHATAQRAPSSSPIRIRSTAARCTPRRCIRARRRWRASAAPCCASTSAASAAAPARSTRATARWTTSAPALDFMARALSGRAAVGGRVLVRRRGSR